ncbi:MAG: hypothetical protein ACK49R_16420 [Planctomycetota bacterium]|jgi:hypothetical protein
MSVEPQPESVAPSFAVPGSENPFSVSRVGLGGIEFLEPQPGWVAAVARRLEEADWRGQIIGPHGSGKTTLTIDLAKLLAGKFERFSWLVVQPAGWFATRPRARVQLAARSVRRGEQSSLELLAFQMEESGGLLAPRLIGTGPRELCFVDGLELLSGWRQRQLRKLSADKSVVFTAHRSLGPALPVLADLQPDWKTFRRVVAKLLESESTHVKSQFLEPQWIERVFRTVEGDFRRGLSQLYDEWESLRLGRSLGRPAKSDLGGIS